ncbi:MAG TPA: hypothetical protein VG992_01855 [Candidatus Saccharimonadales bacterium]|nr:hypothetical protein [Candidatus Saccharimonadales bacterium]
MRTVAILKRKDASSVVVAVVLAMIAWQAVGAWATRPADWLSGVDGSGGGWRLNFWQPLLTLLVSLVVFELLICVYLWLSAGQTSTKKK